LGSIISDERLVVNRSTSRWGRHAGGVAVQLERQRIADFHPQPGIARGVRLVHRRDFDAHQLFAQAGEPSVCSAYIG